MNHKPTLLLMAGLPGAGKTTLAAELGRCLHWTILDKDWLKLSLLKQELGISSEKVGEAAYVLLFAIVEDILVRQQLSVILDTAARYLFILERAIEIANEAEAELKVICCTANTNIRKERISRRPISILYPEDTIINACELETFKHLPPDTLILDTTSSLQSCLELAIEYLI